MPNYSFATLLLASRPTRSTNKPTRSSFDALLAKSAPPSPESGKELIPLFLRTFRMPQKRILLSTYPLLEVRNQRELIRISSQIILAFRQGRSYKAPHNTVSRSLEPRCILTRMLLWMTERRWAVEGLGLLRY